MKNTAWIVLVLPLALWGRKIKSNDLPETVRPEIAAAVARTAALPHPRLFADAAGFAVLKERIQTDELAKTGAEHVRVVADLMLKTQPLVRQLEGRRLLGVCREALYRINTLAMAYRLYGDKAHLDRAVAELKAVCAFSDWNPSHYLDTAEMSLAVATGYDWLWNDMDESTRREIADGLRRHGIAAGHQPAWWIRASNNWGQVCHAGMLAAALVLAEDDVATTGRFVQRCIDCIPYSMKALAPNGNYPEGPGYWSYGVNFNVVALALLEGTLGSDFGLASLPGFRETGEYRDFVTGPSGLTFNYADGGSGRDTCPAPWWFAQRFNRPDLLAYFELAAYRKYVARRDKRLATHGSRLFPLTLFWVRTPSADVATKLPLTWDAQGPVPITVQRSSWNDDEAMFVGLKGGSPSSNHGHMDGGSFVLDTKGVRWAVDIGAESYHGIEKRGMNLWSMQQDSQRWTIYRLGTSSHNTLMLDGCQQWVKGAAKVVKVVGAPVSEVTLDLSSLYTNATTVVRRGTLAADGKKYELKDVVKGFRPGGSVRWSMVTRAAATIDGETVTLRQDGQTLRLAQTGRDRGTWFVAPAKGPNEWDSPNKGCTQLMFTVAADAQGEARLGVTFTRE